MGFGDLFVAALVGCLLAAEGQWSSGDGHGPAGDSGPERSLDLQLIAAALVAALALAFDLLFFTVDELPSTVPVAVALALAQWRRRSGLRSAAATR
jgi:hypothetical protein